MKIPAKIKAQKRAPIPEDTSDSDGNEKRSAIAAKAKAHKRVPIPKDTSDSDGNGKRSIKKQKTVSTPPFDSKEYADKTKLEQDPYKGPEEGPHTRIRIIHKKEGSEHSEDQRHICYNKQGPEEGTSN